jgi:uncharacterized protein YfaT (DUF1175 family)
MAAEPTAGPDWPAVVSEALWLDLAMAEKRITGPQAMWRLRDFSGLSVFAAMDLLQHLDRYLNKTGGLTNAT